MECAQVWGYLRALCDCHARHGSDSSLGSTMNGSFWGRYVKLAMLGGSVLKSSAGMRHALLGTTALIAVGAAVLVSAGDAKAQTWTGGSGSWSSNKWTGSMPNAVDAVATFNVPNSGTDFIDLWGGPFTVRVLNIYANSNAFAAHAGVQFQSGQLIMQASSGGNALINVDSSSTAKEISATLQLNSNTVITTTYLYSTFSVSGSVTGSGSLTIAGQGQV
ncbi:unnamed protein product, partial [marine sediment metagenome]